MVEIELQKLFRGKPIHVTTLRPADFLQNLFMYVPTIKQGALYHNLNPTTAVASIDVFDIANSAAAVLTSPPEKYSGLTFTLTGPEALTKQEVAEKISRHLGRTVNAIQVPEVNSYQQVQQFGIPSQLAYKLVNLSQHYNPPSKIR